MERLGYYSKKNWLMRVETLSLNKMEENYNKYDGRDKDALAAYLYFNFGEKVNKFKHPNLFYEYTSFKESLSKQVKTDTKYKLYKSLVAQANQKKTDEEFKNQFRKWFLEELNNKGVSLKFVVDNTGTKYSNVYNFAHKNMNSKLSRENINKLMDYLN